MLYISIFSPRVPKYYMTAYVRTEQNMRLTAKHLRRESQNCLSIVFERPPGFNYQPGDWIDVAFDEAPGAGVKTFSLSSSPTEADLMISFRPGVSEFKRRLQALQPGRIVRVVQYGNSGLSFKLRQRAVLIAGGVGIAPFRSWLKELADTNTTPEVTLLYFNRAGDTAFRDDIDHWAQTNPYMQVHYLDSALKGHAKKAAVLAHLPAAAEAHYSIAGPPAMAEAMEHLLIASGAPLKRISVDEFTGY